MTGMLSEGFLVSLQIFAFTLLQMQVSKKRIHY